MTTLSINVEAVARAVVGFRPACVVAIDKGIPVPPRKIAPRHAHYGHYVRYPWREMEAGDSFAVPVVGDSVRVQSQMCGMMKRWRRSRPGTQFVSRVLIEDGREVIRVWRTV